MSRATIGLWIFASVAWIHEKSLSATAEARKYGRLWMASTRSLGLRLPATVRFLTGDENPGDLFRRHARLPRRVDRRFNQRGKRVGAGHELDRQVLDDVPLAGRAGQALGDGLVAGASAEDREKAAGRFEHVLIDGIPAAPRPAASAALTAQSAAFAPMYSRAQLLVPIERPPIVIAVMPIACAICSSVSLRSLAAATAPPKATICRRVNATDPAATPLADSARRLIARHDGGEEVLARAPVRSAIASPVDASVVPACAVLRMSLSSEAAASLRIALTRATSCTGSLVPSNQIVASGLPPCSFARSRTMRADAIGEPDAALANVLAMMILACSIASGASAQVCQISSGSGSGHSSSALPGRVSRAVVLPGLRREGDTGRCPGDAGESPDGECPSQQRAPAETQSVRVSIAIMFHGVYSRGFEYPPPGPRRGTTGTAGAFTDLGQTRILSQLLTQVASIVWRGFRTAKPPLRLFMLTCHRSEQSVLLESQQKEAEQRTSHDSPSRVARPMIALRAE